MSKMIAMAGLFVAAQAISARADVGVFTGTGQNLRQISTAHIQLVSIDVTITPVRGRFMFDGTVPGLDQVEYDCKFVLRNLKDAPCEVKAGFPLDSQFAHPAEARRGESVDWVSAYSFIARDEETTYHPRVGWWKHKDAEDSVGMLTWPMKFEPRQTRLLKVQYRLPMSESLAATSKRGTDSGPSNETGNPWLDSSLLTGCLVEFAGYTTETGSSWAGNVERASFRLSTAQFERYLDQRALYDCLPPGVLDDESELDDDKASMRSVVSRHVWWYREIKPEGWRATEDGVQWDYKDFKPKDPIGIRYYLTFFPRVPGEVDAWIDDLCKAVPDRKMSPDDLAMIRQVFLATYGQEPKDDAVRKFAEDQAWFRPRKDFSLSNLTPDQRAILTAIDLRIEAMKSGK